MKKKDYRPQIHALFEEACAKRKIERKHMNI